MLYSEQRCGKEGRVRKTRRERESMTLEKRWGGRGVERIDTALLGEVEVGLNWVESGTG